ncbi:uncharacterized protein LOC114518917 [Dendronephthya gigantea]|uniref:uncharacterized protein LOC114518917 n=1 Tax=Dendronephthya gigantea TaxID=151771 RepID=UPI001069C073|nr:uncharacterized protein LOC114518917 [Dendronephthya gigantea]
MSCAPAGDDPDANVEYYVSLLDSGKQLAYNGNVEVYKPVKFLKPPPGDGEILLRVTRKRWESNWWLIPIKVDSEVQSLHIGADSQLFMGDAVLEKFEAVILLFDPNSQRIFSMMNPNQSLVIGASGEAKMMENGDSKYSLDAAK